MFAHLLARALGRSGPHFACRAGLLTARTVLLLGAALLAGCSTLPPAPLAGTKPSDPGAAIPRAAYRPVIGPYASRRPGDPSEWRQQNDRIAPEVKP